MCLTLFFCLINSGILTLEPMYVNMASPFTKARVIIGESPSHLSKEDISSIIVIKKYLVEEVCIFVDN